MAAASLRVVGQSRKRTRVRVADIQNKFDVRSAIDEDRVLQIAEAYRSGESIPLIEVVRYEGDKLAYFDGRHRGQALRYLYGPDAETDIYILPGSFEENAVQIFGQALKANWGGSKPPTSEDIVKTMLHMLETGGKEGELREQLEFLPKSSFRIYLQKAKSVVAKRRLSLALDDVASGNYSVADAARRHRINVDKLKAAIVGDRKGRGLGNNPENQAKIEYTGHVATQMKTANRSIVKKLEGMIHSVQDGELTANTANCVLKEWRERNRRQALMIEDCQARLDAASPSAKHAPAKTRFAAAG